MDFVKEKQYNLRLHSLTIYSLLIEEVVRSSAAKVCDWF